MLLNIGALMSAMSNPNEPGTYTQAVKALLLNRILLILSFIGLIDAGALSLEKLMNVVLPCGEGHGCALVAADPSSNLFGVIPVAYIGFVGYLLFAGLAIGRALTIPNHALMTKVGFYASIFGAAFSIYLQYISLFKIHAVCYYCLTSAITMIITVVLYAVLNKSVGKDSGVTSGDVGRLDMWLLGGGPIVVILGLAMFASNDSKPTKSVLDAKAKEPVLAEMVASNPKAFGVDTAPMTIVEFADLCCPACQDKSPKVKQFINEHVGKVRLVYKNFPLNMHPLGRTAAAIGEYAHEKGKFWDYAIGVLSLNRQPESGAELLSLAKSAGLDPEDIKKRLKDTSDSVYDKLADDMNLAHRVGVNSTPTFFVFVKGMKTQVLGPRDIFDRLNGPEYAKVLGNG